MLCENNEDQLLTLVLYRKTFTFVFDRVKV
jgi:hypothetical protein